MHTRSHDALGEDDADPNGGDADDCDEHERRRHARQGVQAFVARCRLHLRVVRQQRRARRIVQRSARCKQRIEQLRHIRGSALTWPVLARSCSAAASQRACSARRCSFARSSAPRSAAQSNSLAVCPARQDGELTNNNDDSANQCRGQQLLRLHQVEDLRLVLRDLVGARLRRIVAWLHHDNKRFQRTRE